MTRPMRYRVEQVARKGVVRQVIDRPFDAAWAARREAKERNERRLLLALHWVAVNEDGEAV